MATRLQEMHIIALYFLKTIWGICLNYKNSEPNVLSLNNTLSNTLCYTEIQNKLMTIFKAFNIIFSLYEHLGGTTVHGTAFDDEMKAIVDASTQDKGFGQKKAIATICGKVLATAYIERSGNRYSALKRELTIVLLCNDRYPTDPAFTPAHFSWTSHKYWEWFPTANSFRSLLTTNFKDKAVT